MKIFNTKKKDRRWTIVLATDEEARRFNHFVQCASHPIPSSCIHLEATEDFSKTLLREVKANNLPC